ncbi:hypothetical protein CFP56_030152 [Quercus suber]|uniref:Uncharacterized protein n=1 Tax=Quercus suber TaxID=58331 RepID=A0AAW0LV15_QUESU
MELTAAEFAGAMRENELRKQPLDKSFLPLPSLLAQTSTIPHTKLTATEFAEAVPFRQVYLLWLLNSPLSTLASGTQLNKFAKLGKFTIVILKYKIT